MARKEDIQFAENESIQENSGNDFIEDRSEFERKRKLLEKTKITKQTWSIREIFQKRKEKELIVDTDYQRNVIWDNNKKTAFIESLFMEIMIPPIYVVEIASEDLLEGNKYEVVDGKQRLTAIEEFLKNNLELKEKSLEYYRDLFGGKVFNDIKESYSEKITQLLSYVLDIYVITANSPDSTKYDIFARLNKGSEPLKVNELRRAIYCSDTTRVITKFVDEWTPKNKTTDSDLQKKYSKIFTKNDMKRYDDYGRFYKSIAFYYRNNLREMKVEDYNSRPREMINDVLLHLQKEGSRVNLEQIKVILEKTIELKLLLNEFDNGDYIIDACINYAVAEWDNLLVKLDQIKTDEEIISTFNKSVATTSNVNKRLSRVVSIMEG